MPPRKVRIGIADTFAGFHLNVRPTRMVYRIIKQSVQTYTLLITMLSLLLRVVTCDFCELVLSLNSARK